MTDRELALRREIFVLFAETGAPPEPEDRDALAALADRHVVALGEDGRILMAHPFAGHRDGTRVASGGREWWGNCAWDGLGIVAALGLEEATLHANGLTLELRGGEVQSADAVFQVAVPARHWWDDIVFT
jgi:hypothetical protein